MPTLIVPETADYLYDALLAARTTVLVFAGTSGVDAGI